MTSAFSLMSKLGGFALLSTSTFAYYIHQKNDVYSIASCKAYQFYENRENSPQFNKKEWDSNWDRRQECKKIEIGPSHATKEPSKNDLIAEDKRAVSATRHVILIRHGQYDTTGKHDHLRILTEVGREQAILTGERLKSLDMKFDKVIISTMARAKETGHLICENLPDVERTYCDLLREGKPYPVEPSTKSSLSDSWKLDLFKDNPRIEGAYRKYIHRADSKQEKDSYDLIVCHANVIRYFICRALQSPPEGWLRMGIAHCGITCISIRPNGNISIKGIGNAGHLPPNLVTYS